MVMNHLLNGMILQVDDPMKSQHILKFIHVSEKAFSTMTAVTRFIITKTATKMKKMRKNAQEQFEVGVAIYFLLGGGGANHQKHKRQAYGLKPGRWRFPCVGLNPITKTYCLTTSGFPIWRISQSQIVGSFILAMTTNQPTKGAL